MYVFAKPCPIDWENMYIYKHAYTLYNEYTTKFVSMHLSYLEVNCKILLCKISHCMCHLFLLVSLS